jgi:hypothetical protein
MSRLLLIALWVTSLSSFAQGRLGPPVVEVCDEALRCSALAQSPLAAAEASYIEHLVQALPARASQREVEKLFDLLPSSASPTTQFSNPTRSGSAYRASWEVQGQRAPFLASRVDVYFLEDQAYMVRVWLDGHRKLVRIRFAE